MYVDVFYSLLEGEKLQNIEDSLLVGLAKRLLIFAPSNQSEYLEVFWEKIFILHMSH